MDDAYLRVGDVITLESEKNCFLSMDPVSLTVLWQLSPDRKNAPVNIENCLWRVCPRLSYVDQELYEQSKKKHGDSDPVNSDIEAQAEMEKKRNETDVESIKSAVLFGQVIQLQHLMSGLFLNCLKHPSKQDADCFQLRLGQGSADAYLKVMSMYKIRTDGGNVMLGDDVVFASMSIPHHSVYKSVRPSPHTTSYGALYDEASLSRNRSMTKISVNLFSRVTPYEGRSLCTTQGLRFFDSESNSFLEASCELRTFVDNVDKIVHLQEIDSSVPYAGHPNAMKAAALWTFVTPDRKHCEHVVWNKPYRIKHIPTSKYLTVVSYADNNGSTKYSVELEDENANPHDQLFLVLAVEKPGEFVECSDVMIHLCHESVNGERLFVRKGHHSEHKARTELYLDVEMNNYDAFMIMEAKKEVVDIIKFNYMSWRVAQRYARFFVKDKEPLPIETVRMEYMSERMGNNTRKRASTVAPKSSLAKSASNVASMLRFADQQQDEETLKDDGVEIVELDEETHDEENVEELREHMFSMLKSLLFELVVGDQDEDTDLFTMDGECDEVVQNCAREQYLLEALLTALVAPVMADVIQEHQDNAKVGSLGEKEPVTFKSIHLLGWIVMKHLIKDNVKSEIYLVHSVDIDSIVVKELKPLIESKTTTKIKAADGTEMSFSVARIINQIPFRLGAASALTTLISNNKSLLLSFVNEATLNFFRDLICQWGPDKSFLEVFRAICSCKGVALQDNQRKCLALMEKSQHEPFVLDVFTKPGDVYSNSSDSPMLVQSLGEGEPSRNEPEGNFFRKFTHTEADEVVVEMKEDSEEYLGQDGIERGFPKLYVSWTGSDDWRRGQSTLYYSPAALSLSTVDSSKSCISLETLCFPLKLDEDADLCSSDEEMLSKMESFYGVEGDRKRVEQLFLDHKFVCEYFAEQMRLYAEMCLGRCFETTDYFAKKFNFDILYAGMANTDLPFSFRSAFSDLMRTLVLDRFPQLYNCGNYRIPVSVYILEDLDFKDNDVNHTLPSFSVPSKFNSDDELYRFKTPKKFELLVAYCNKYLSMRVGAQCSDPVFEDKNRCTLSILKTIDNLVSFGFYDTVQELKEVVRPIVQMIDGRMMTEDVGEVPGYTYADYKHGQLVPVRTVETEKRYTIQDSTADIMDAKMSMLSVFSYVKSIRGQFRLKRFLSYFAELRREMDEVKVGASQIANITEILTDDRLNIETLSGVHYTDTIFVDLLMYEDEELFERVLSVLIEEHEPTKALLENCKHVHFLVNDKLDAPMLTYDTLTSEIWELQHLMATVEEWCGIRHQLIASKYIRTKNILVRIRQYLYSGLVGDHSVFMESTPQLQLKEFLYSLNVHNILFGSLEWDLSSSSPVSDDDLVWVESDEVVAYDLAPIVSRCLVILSDLVCDKSRQAFAQVLNVDFIAEKNKNKHIRRQLYHLLYETFQGSEEQVENTPEEVIFIFAQLLSDPELKSVAMSFFEEQLCPGIYESEPIHRNQDVVAHAILDNITLFLVNTQDVEKTLNTYVSCLNLIAECCRENDQNRNLLQFLFPTKTMMTRIEGVVSYLLSSECEHEQLSQHAVLLDAYVDVFCMVCIDEASKDESFQQQLQFFLALAYKNLNAAHPNVCMVLDPILKLASSYCEVSMNSSDLCFLGLRCLCDTIVSQAQSSAFTPATGIWSTTKVLAMDILALSGEMREKLEKKRPSPHGPQRASSSPFARKKLVASYDSSKATGFTKTKLKISSSGPLESHRNFFIPSVVRSIEKDLHSGEEELLANLQDAVDNFEAKMKVETVVEEDNTAKSDLNLLGVNPLAGGLHLASKAGTGLLSATSSVTKAGKAKVKSAGTLLEGAVEMGSRLGGQKKTNKNESAQDMHLQWELRNFVKRVSQNKRIKSMLVHEKQYLVNLFVNAENLTDPNTEDYIRYLEKNASSEAATSADVSKGETIAGKKQKRNQKNTARSSFTMGFGNLAAFMGGSADAGEHEVRTNVITWKHLVSRMIKHVDYKVSRAEAGSVVCKHILHLFNLYLLGEDDGEDLEARQNLLNEWGVLRMCFRIIKTGKDGPLFIPALQLLNLILSEGNTLCQDSLLSYMKSSSSGDADGQFFKAIFDTVEAATVWAQANQRRTGSTMQGSEIVISAAQSAEIEIFNTALMFAKEFCEGHHREAQDSLREQTFNRRTYNIISAVNDLLDVLAPRRDIYQSIGMMRYSVLCTTLDVLVECIQGPCPENQVLCVQRKCLEVGKQIITTHVLPHIAESVKYDSRVKAIILLSSLLENRHDNYIEELMASKIERYKLDDFGKELAKELDKSNDIAKQKRKFKAALFSEAGEDDGNVDSTEATKEKQGADKDGQDEADEGGEVDEEPDEEEERKSFKTVYTKFDPAENVELHIQDIKQAITNLYKVSKCIERIDESNAVARRGDPGSAQFESMMCELDIFWNGKVEQVVFPVPEEATDLSETTKIEFMNNCDLGTRETRLKALMDEAENFHNEMVVYNHLAEFEFYGWLLDNYIYFKAGVLAVVVLLVMSVLFGHIDKSHNVNKHRNEGSEAFTIVLSVIAVVGYFIMFLYWLIPQVFIAVKVNKERLLKMRREAKQGNVVRTWHYDWGTMLLPFISMPFLILIFVMHYVAFDNVLNASDDFLTSRYVIVAVILYGIWLPISFRKAITSPNNFLEEIFCIAFDLLANPAIFEHLGCTILLIVGYKYLYLYAFVLLDFISMSEHMKNVVRAVTRPITALCSVFILFIFVVLIFAIIGFFVFDDPFIINEEEIEVDDGGAVSQSDNVFCTSPMGCFWDVAYGAVRAGDIAEIMPEISPDMGDRYYTRLLFDMLFFVILGVLLFDMVTGIIVDTFVSLREDTSAREEIMTNEVFVSGITQEMCTDKGVSFKDHQEKYQHAWNYINFYVYLVNSDKTELNGAEHYVWNCIQQNDISWFPRLTSSTLQNEEEESNAEALMSEMSARMLRLETSVAELSAKLK